MYVKVGSEMSIIRCGGICEFTCRVCVYFYVDICFEWCLCEETPCEALKFGEGCAWWGVMNVDTAFFGFSSKFDNEGEVSCTVYIMLAVFSCLVYCWCGCISTPVIAVA